MSIDTAIDAEIDKAIGAAFDAFALALEEGMIPAEAAKHIAKTAHDLAEEKLRRRG